MIQNSDANWTYHQAHVIFGAIKTSSFRSPYLRIKGLLGLGLTTIPMVGRSPTFSSSNTPHSHHIRLGFFLDQKIAIDATTSTSFEANA
jgi:hypothetical protein